jgi:hypothetical protein
MSQKFLQIQPCKLAGSGITATATTIVLQSLADPQGNTVLTADIGDACYATLEPNTTREEIISFTTITQNSDGTATLTGVTRNLDYVSPYTQISATGFVHSGGTPLIISNNPQLYNDMLSNSNDETITGTYTFDADKYPKVDDASKPPTADAEFATKKYADDLAIAGAPDSTTTVKGIVEKATSAETQAGSDTGGTSAPLFAAPSDIAANIQNSKFIYAADAEASDTYVITLTPAIASYATGQVFVFKANTANTGAATLNVNGKGAKTIKKLHDQDLETNDIEAGSIVTVVYDGTNMQLQTPQATLPSTAILGEMNTFFGATDITGAEAETLTNGSEASSLHHHGTDLVASGTIYPNIASANLLNLYPVLAASNATVNVTTDAYAKVKEIVAGRGGTVIVAFNLSSAGTDTVYGRIYVNGVAVGTERSDNSGVAVWFLESITIVRGDLIQLYCKRTTSGGTNYAAEFKIMAKGIDGFVVNT